MNGKQQWLSPVEMLLIIDRISSNFKFRLYKNNSTKLWITQSDRYIVNQEDLKLFGLSSKSMSLYVWLQYLTQIRLLIISTIRCFAFYNAVCLWRILFIEHQCAAEHWSWVVPIYSHVQLLQLFTWKLKMFHSDVPFVQTLTPSLWSPHSAVAGQLDYHCSHVSLAVDLNLNNRCCSSERTYIEI